MAGWPWLTWGTKSLQKPRSKPLERPKEVLSKKCLKL